MHLQWCWGPFAIIRAHQLTDFLDGARGQRFNPFGIGETSTVGGHSYDGRREDLYLLRALTEVNLTSSSIVEGHDLMAEYNDMHKWQLENGRITSFPTTVKIDPLSQDNNHGFLVVKLAEDETRYAFCKGTEEMEPICASKYLVPYMDELAGWVPEDRDAIASMVERLDSMPLLTREEMCAIFNREYDKEKNIEGFQVPEVEKEHERPVDDLVKEAKDRAGSRDAPSAPAKQRATPEL